jgi:hypothetical protein
MADTHTCGNCGKPVDPEGLYIYAGFPSPPDDPIAAWCDWSCMVADVSRRRDQDTARS